MALPSAWVESLFARLQTRYGVAFSQQYDGIGIEAVKADWAHTLDGVSGEALHYALDRLPSERAPNVMQFRDLARCYTPPDRAALPPPLAHQDDDVRRRIEHHRARVRAGIDALNARNAMTHDDGVTRITPAESLYMRLRDAEARNGGLTQPQRAQIEAMRERGLLSRFFPEDDAAMHVHDGGIEVIEGGYE